MIRGFILLLFFSSLFSQQTENHVDGVLAVVGDLVVLKSDVFEQSLLLAKQKNINPQKSPLAFERLFKKTLSEKIDRLFVLNAAIQDTSVEVSFDEINLNLEERINSFADVFGSKEALEDTMKMSLSEIKNEYWETVKEEIYVEKFRNKTFGTTVINRQEVVSFFSENPDSFPSPDPLFEFSILEKPVEVGQTTKDSIFSLISSLKDSLDLGLLLFEDVAKKYSQDPGSSINGGDLSYTQRGSLLPAYEKVAFSLKKGDVSMPVETVFGIHLIKLIDRVGEKIHSKHILFRLSPGPQDLLFLQKEFEKHLQENLNDPGAFDSLCVKNKNVFKNNSGVFVDFNINNLPLFLQKKVVSTQDFSFSSVFIENSSIFLIYKYKQKKVIPLSLETDWGLIESIALTYKRFNLLEEWITKEKEKTYIEIFTNEPF